MYCIFTWRLATALLTTQNWILFWLSFDNCACLDRSVLHCFPSNPVEKAHCATFYVGYIWSAHVSVTQHNTQIMTCGHRSVLWLVRSAAKAIMGLATLLTRVVFGRKYMPVHPVASTGDNIYVTFLLPTPPIQVSGRCNNTVEPWIASNLVCECFTRRAKILKEF
jgi:hypothetical protein